MTASGVASGNYTINPGWMVTQIACGGWVVSPFTPDTDYTGGTTYSTNVPITVAGVANAAPMAVYQTYRYGACSYTVPNITPGATCTVRLHFEEPGCTSAGQRQFNVSINGVQVLTNFDIFATAGAQYTAVVETFTATADSNGNVTIALSNGNAGVPLICGIEVLVTSIIVAPSFSPAAGTYASAQTVTISTTTSGATINYTTNGVTPSSSVGTVYSSPIMIGANATLQAIGYMSGTGNSPVTTGNYYIQCAAPTFSPAAGIYSSALSVTISTTTGGATIRYTTDGSTPTETAGTVYSTPVLISASANFQAIAYMTGMADSPVTGSIYTIATPPPSSGLVLWLRADTGVTMSGGAVSAWADRSGNGYNAAQSTSTLQPTFVSHGLGSMPALSFTGNDSLENMTANLLPSGNARTVFVVGEANAAGNGGTLLTFRLNSTDAAFSCMNYNSFFYIYGDDATTDAYIPNALTTVQSPFMVDFTTAGAGDAIQCYLNGVNESVSYLYGSCFMSDTGPTGMVVGNRYSTSGMPWYGDIAEILVYDTNLSDSVRMQVETYLRARYNTLPAACAAPTFSPAAGMYSSAQSVTISTTTGGATIRYTTDGSTPTETAGTVYSTPVLISTSANFQAIAYNAGMIDSTVTSSVYTIATPPPASGLVLWLRADTGVTASDGAVSAWADQSGNGYNVAQSTSTLQPTFVINGLGSMPALSFTGNDSLENMAANLLAAGSARTVFAVADANAAGNGGTLLTFRLNTPDAAFSCMNYNSFFYIYCDDNTTDAYIPNALTTVQSPFMVDFSTAGTSDPIQCYLNGISQSVNYLYGSCFMSDTGPTGLVVGNRYSTSGMPWYGTIAEILVYNTNVSTSVRQQVETYLRAKYSSLPPGCATPTFSPAAGTYANAQSVTIGTTTNGATIRYTTDGSTPSETAGTVYSSPVSITATLTTLQAIAYESGVEDSSIASGVYTLQCATPAFSPAAGTYHAAQTVTISTATSGATIRYTTNGTTPSSTIGTVYSSAVSITATGTTLQAIAYETNYTNSSVASGVYTLTCAAPAFNPAAGAYGPAQTVTISTTTSGATINYTTNGTTPSSTVGTVYSSAVTISATATLEAIAYETGYANSTVTTGVYTINGACATPTFSPAAGTFTTSTSVTISTTTGGATIRYTTNGTTPSSTVGTVYSSAVSISATSTLQAIAYKTGYSDSAVASGVYTIQCATPAYSPVAGTYSHVDSVTISTATSGATIRYTTNGTTPSSTVGTVYSSAVSITATSTLQAIAYKTG